MDVEVEQVRVLTGFSVEWERRPHRVKVLGVDVGADVPQVDVQGGAWANGERGTDVAHVDVGVRTLAGRTAISGDTTLDVRGTRRAPAAGDTTLVVPIDGPAAAVFLTGFRFEVGPDHRNGYTLHALSVGLGTPVVEGGVATVPLHVELDGGPVPDRLQRFGRSYGTAVSVSWVVVGCAADDVARGSADASVRGWSVLRRQPADDAVAVSVRLPPNSLVGLSGFAIDVGDGPLDGRYTRHLAVWTEPAVGAISPMRLAFDNAGILARPVRVALTAELTALGLAPGEVVQDHSLSLPAD